MLLRPVEMASLHIVVQIDSLQYGDGQFHFKALINVILPGGDLLPHYISVSMDLGKLAMLEIITTDCRLTHHAVKYVPSIS